MSATNDLLKQAIVEIIKEQFNEVVDVPKLNEELDKRVSSILPAIDNKLKAFEQRLEASSSRHSSQPLEINVTRSPSTPPDKVEVGIQHKKFKTLLQFMESRIPVYIYGPTGTGKTKAIFVIAKQVLKVAVHAVTLHPQSAVSQLFGYMDANGNYVEGAAYKVYKDGGVLLINELDNGSAAANAAMNQLSDEECFFPNGQVKQHPEFFMMATANTLGNGANRQYVGRSPQDKALLNRFAFLNWDWDYSLERKVALQEYVNYGGKHMPEAETAMIDFWKMRLAINELNIDHILSLRNLLHLMRLKARATDINTITGCVIARGLDKDQYRKIATKAASVQLPTEAFVGGGSGGSGLLAPSNSSSEDKPAIDVEELEPGF